MLSTIPASDQRHVVDDIVTLDHALWKRLEMVDHAGVADDRADRAAEKLAEVVAQPQDEQQREGDNRRDDLVAASGSTPTSPTERNAAACSKIPR